MRHGSRRRRKGKIETIREGTHPKDVLTSRNTYLFRPATEIWASSLWRTMRSQITTSFLVCICWSGTTNNGGRGQYAYALLIFVLGGHIQEELLGIPVEERREIFGRRLDEHTHNYCGERKKMEPAVRLKFTKVKSWFLFAYLRALPGKLEPYEVGEHTRFKEYIHFDVCYA